jgi:CRISPR/Cas system Type II protein with McrA/HNH and RuvC-like nuclease domain
MYEYVISMIDLIVIEVPSDAYLVEVRISIKKMQDNQVTLKSNALEQAGITLTEGGSHRGNSNKMEKLLLFYEQKGDDIYSGKSLGRAKDI